MREIPPGLYESEFVKLRPEHVMSSRTSRANWESCDLFPDAASLLDDLAHPTDGMKARLRTRTQIDSTWSSIRARAVADAADVVMGSSSR